MAAEELTATVHMMKFMAEQITRLIDLQKTQADQQQQMMKNSLESQGGQKKNWDNVEKFKNIKQFSGEAKEWEEFATKFRSQAGANDVRVAGIFDMAENELKE
jgi:hypothetical protein